MNISNEHNCIEVFTLHSAGSSASSEQGRPRGILSLNIMLSSTDVNDFLYGSAKVRKTSKQQNPQLTARVNRLVCKACCFWCCSQELTLLWSPSNTTVLPPVHQSVSLTPAEWKGALGTFSIFLCKGIKCLQCKLLSACNASSWCMTPCRKQNASAKCHRGHTWAQAIPQQYSKGTCLNYCHQVFICCKYLTNTGFP